MFTSWICPRCDYSNFSASNLLIVPCCKACFASHSWDQIATSSDNLELYLNVCDRLAGQLYGCSAVELLENEDEAVELLKRYFSNSETPNKAIAMLRKLQSKRLWYLLGCTPIDVNGFVEESFECFPKGTHRETIWAWFEDNFDVSVVTDLMFPNKMPEA